MPSFDVLLERMPRPGRVASECGLVLTLFAVPGLAAAAVPAKWTAYALAGAFAVWGAWALALTRRRRLAALAALVGVAATLWFSAFGRPRTPARLGVELADRDGGAEVTAVSARSAAEGRLQPGDRILSVAGQPLARSGPSDDLRARLADEARVPAGPTRLTVARGASELEVTVPLGSVPRGPQLGARELLWLIWRALAGLLIIGALVAAAGQSARHIGLAPERMGVEALWGGPVLAATMVVHVSVSVPLALILSKTSFLGREMSQRLDALRGLFTEVNLGELALAMILLAGFEEVVFRGFLLPRVRSLLGRWWVAVVVVQLLFGLGHLYEGGLAVLQTAVLGACFAAAFLWRAHLGSAIVAHAAFNTLTITLMAAVQRSGLLEKLPIPR
jgi:CAAX protease family protein